MAESRVFCQDSNAIPWTAKGFSCPVICASVRNAIEKLIMLDYEKTVQQQLREKRINNINEKTIQNSFYLRKSIDNTIDNTEIIEPGATDYENNINTTDTIQNGIFEHLRNAKGILRRSGNAYVDFDKTEAKKCWFLDKFHEGQLVGKVVRKKCTRKSNFDAKFLSIMTNVLNKHSDSMFKFTEDMTEILLESIFGKNTDLRNNIFDVNRLLKYLRKAVDLHKSHTQNVITLKSTHCLTLAAPGCYCKPGYVENDGQCVSPSDCVSEYHAQYLSRIIIL